MKTKTGWLIVILISSVQLALLLIAAIALFSWFTDQTDQTVATQICSDNEAMAEQLAQSIENDEISTEALASGDPDALEQVKKVISSVHMPNYGFVSIYLPGQNMPLYSFPEYPSLENGALAESEYSSRDNTAQPLKKSITARVPKRTSGTLQFEGRQHFVATSPVAGGATIVVAQQRSQAVAAMAGSIDTARKIFFAAILLVGLACMCLIVAILNRMTAKVQDHSLGLEKQVTEREHQIVRTQNAVIFGLAKLAESRDNDTGEHLDRIRSYVMILSEDLERQIDEIDSEFVSTIALASSLHDVGKVGIPDSILLKPGRLSKEEREVMELHTLIGGDCLEAIQSRLGDDNMFMQIAKQIAYYHHERWDGNGYPHGLAGDEIPLVARIVAVADVYDALTSKRPYKEPLSHIESKGIILAGSGTQFDPEVVNAFLRHEDEFEAISRSQKQLTDDDVRSDFHVLCERAQLSADAEAAEQS